MRLFHLEGRYTTIHFQLNEDDLCIVKVRNEEPRLAPMKEMTERFHSIPWVKGCGGITDSFIFNTETKEVTPINIEDL